MDLKDLILAEKAIVPLGGAGDNAVDSLSRSRDYPWRLRDLWVFEVKPGLDENGEEVKLDIFAFTESENQRPLPFKARFVPRAAGIVDLVGKEAKQAEEALAVYDGKSDLRL